MSKGITAEPMALSKSLSLFTQIVGSGRGRSLSALAAEVGIPLSTAHRMAIGLERSGFLLRVGRGRFIPGPFLSRLDCSRREWNAFAARVSRPILARLSNATGKITHFGVFEDNMVTYLVKVGDPNRAMISREGMQLEAYCSALGKVVLAHLPPEERESYLEAGTFVALTNNTITVPLELAEELEKINKIGYAIDQGEIIQDLVCLAVPIQSTHRVPAAISMVVTTTETDSCPIRYLDMLRDAAHEIEGRLFPYEKPAAPGLQA